MSRTDPITGRSTRSAFCSYQARPRFVRFWLSHELGGHHSTGRIEDARHYQACGYQIVRVELRRRYPLPSERVA